eukprot:comp23383_c4_seq5/m.38718 comp23383_c4_seq5/g.38718  ORF comp23383_c4_seq5/g.38718 comp23383_c4_seq5/m.38718 type:complete len:142 (-) comp23383_c4_seq5:20-445(-)
MRETRPHKTHWNDAVDAAANTNEDMTKGAHGMNQEEHVWAGQMTGATHTAGSQEALSMDLDSASKSSGCPSAEKDSTNVLSANPFHSSYQPMASPPTVIYFFLATPCNCVVSFPKSTLSLSCPSVLHALDFCCACEFSSLT